MNEYRAKQAAEKLTDRYLFAKRVQYAGFEDNDDSELADERIVEIFKSVVAVGVGQSSTEDYLLRLYHFGAKEDVTLIAAECQVDPQDIVFEYTTAFEAQEQDFLKKFLEFAGGLNKFKKNRPLTIGSSISHMAAGGFGSIGCFVRDKAGERYLLSNQHVLFESQSKYQDDFIVQPASCHGGGQGDVVGLLYTTLPFNLDDINQFDVALAGPLAKDINIDSYIPFSDDEKRQLKGSREPEYNMSVYKHGASTRTTRGIIVDLSVTVRVNFPGREDVLFRDVILIKGTTRRFGRMEPFSEPGDSGSVVINEEDDFGIGLLFAGSKTGYSLACPLDQIVNLLSVDLI